MHVLVAAAGQAHHDHGVRAELPADLERAGQRVRGLDRRDDALGAAQQRERVHRLGVGDLAVLGAAAVAQPRVLGADAGVVEARGDRVGFEGLAVVVLQQVGPHAVDDAEGAADQRRGVPAAGDAVAARLEPVQPDGRVGDEGVEGADRVGAAADAGDDGVREGPGQLDALPPRLDPDDPLEVADHRRERVRAHDGADAVVGVGDGGDPVAERLVAGVLEGAAAGAHRDHLGAEHAHPGDVQRLSLGVDLAHVDGAGQAEQGGGGGGGDAVLPGAGLGDQAGLAHPPGEQRLAQHIVDLV